MEDIWYKFDGERIIAYKSAGQSSQVTWSGLNLSVELSIRKECLYEDGI